MSKPVLIQSTSLTVIRDNALCIDLSLLPSEMLFE